MTRTEYIETINKTNSSKESENVKSILKLLIAEEYIESLELECESHLSSLMLSRKEKQLLEAQLREAQSTIAKLMDES